MADQVSKQKCSDFHSRDYALNYSLYGLLLYQILLSLYPVIIFWELIQSKKKKKILIMNNVICKKIYCIVLCVIGSNPNVQIGAQLSKWYMSR